MSSSSFEYPKPDRSGRRPNNTKTEEQPEIDIGWSEGFMSDGVPYRAECWAQDQVTMMTLFFSAHGKESWTNQQLIDLLLTEKIVKFLTDHRYVEALPLLDDAGQGMWSVNVVMGDESNLFADYSAPLRPYD